MRQYIITNSRFAVVARFVFLAIELQLNHLAAIEPWQVDACCVVENLGASLAFGMAQHAVAVVQIPVQLHDTKARGLRGHCRDEGSAGFWRVALELGNG